LKVLSQMLALVSMVSLVAAPLWKLGKFFYVPGRLDKVKRTNVNVTLAILAVAALFVIFCPLPYRVLCTLEIKPRGADPVYAKVPGILEQINVTAGQQVKAGDLLGRLSNVDLELEISEIESKIAQQEARLAILTNDQFVLHSEEAAKELPEAEKRIEALREQLQEKKEDEARLRLVARADGTVMPAPEVPAKPEHEGDLKKWSGSPLNERNLGAYLTPPALYCQVGDPREMEAILYIDQDDIEFVRPGQHLAIKLDEIPYETFPSEIAEIGEELKFTPRQLSSKSGGELMSKSDEHGTERPINTTFQARCELHLKPEDAGKLVQGLRGTAKIHAEWQPIGKRFWRYLVRTFNFKL
jgi:putative peptide zinc metalloprotease protein